MSTRPLGRSGLAVPPLVFGGNVLGWTVSQDESFSILDAWLDTGMNFFDTADMYSRWAPGNRGGESEVILGNWLARRGRRDDIIIATKVGMEMGPGAKGLGHTYIARAVEDSLTRLQTDYIDLYQSHEDDPDTPMTDTLGAYAKLIEQGKVRVIGASNFSAPRLAEAIMTSERHGLPRYESIQPEYNLYTREPYESHLQDLVQAQEIGTINYFALASGFLTGKYRHMEDASRSARGSGVVQTYLNPRGERILAALDAVAQETGATLAQITLAWERSQPGITAPIVSATSVAHVAELAQAATLTLTADQLDMLAAASAWR